jgi:hypothetical protein
MATTESRTGFRLPWSSEERSDKATNGRTAEAGATDEATDAVTETTATAPASTETTDDAPAVGQATDESSASSEDQVGEAGQPIESSDTVQPTASDTSPKEASVESTLTASAPSRLTSPAPAAKPPTKFVLDLTRAMQTAAEDSRAQTMSQFQADAKTYIEEIHSRSAVEATELRKRSDEDISGIQDWSKAEIARIREETQGKIADRKQGLERELEDHAGQIEYEIDRVQSRVAGFELEMERFFEQLVAEQDPTQIAAMAQNLPEPPPFDASLPWQPSAAVAELIGDTPVEALSGPDEVEPAGVADPEAAMAAIEAAHHAAEQAEGSEAVSGEGEATPAEASETPESAETTETAADDPRLAALGLANGFDAAEAEAAAAATGAEPAAEKTDDEIPTIGDDALAARLNGLVPADGETDGRPTRATSEATSKVVVTGLVSVASIASFKRHLGRVTGVQSVGVSSGPDGEFVFTVSHDAGVNPSEVVPSLPGFRARVTNVTDNVVSVTAHDPESGS